jgi:hypothetical protein
MPFIGNKPTAIPLSADDLEDNIISTAKIQDNAVTPAKYIEPVPFRNIIINGDMSIAQRGTSVTGKVQGGYFTIDRFAFLTVTGSNAEFTLSQDNDAPTGQGFVKSYKVDCTTAHTVTGSNQIAIRQFVEGQNLQYLKKGTANAESLTLSFWVKSNKTGTYIAELYDQDNTRQISKSYTINSADTWEKKTITYAGDTTGVFDNDNGGSLMVSLWLAAGSDFTSGTLSTDWSSATNANRAVGQVNIADSTSNYINITGVQLEAGTSASDFEFLPYDVNLRRCQRYYEVIGDGSQLSVAQIINATAYTSINAYGVYKYREVMRASPSLDIVTGTAFYRWRSAGTSYTFDTISFSNGTNSTGRISVAFSGATAGYSGWITINAQTTGFVALDAEL